MRIECGPGGLRFANFLWGVIFVTCQAHGSRQNSQTTGKAGADTLPGCGPCCIKADE